MLIGGGSLRQLNIFSNLFIVVVHYTHQHMLCIVAIVDCIMYIVHHAIVHNIPYLVAIIQGQL